MLSETEGLLETLALTEELGDKLTDEEGDIDGLILLLEEADALGLLLGLTLGLMLGDFD